MSSVVPSEPKPDYWYLIPHGYIPLDLDPPVEQIEALIARVRSLPGDRRDQAERVLRFYAGIVTSMNAEGVSACLFGMHPDEEGAPVFSTLTFSTVTTPGNAKLAVAGLAAATHGTADSGVIPLELPCGLGYLSEEKREMAAPGQQSAAGRADLPMAEVWQGTVGIAGRGSEVVVIQMATPAVESGDTYRDILLGIAHTFSFTDPNEPDEDSSQGGNSEPGSVAAAIRSDFG
ncbi:hypothetical protein [Streptomyces sp. NPDC093568]|uniref:hypothetical protein n=1 Tax=Streptomyces sp. NPDC093568 TaxID=3366041 RepID=UPI00381E4829